MLSMQWVRLFIIVWSKFIEKQKIAKITQAHPLIFASTENYCSICSILHFLQWVGCKKLSWKSASADQVIENASQMVNKPQYSAASL